MPTPSTLLTFMVATLAILVVPGPSVTYVVARSLESGRGAGLLSMLGLETGALLHVIAAAIGLGALLASSDLAFRLVTYAGAAYLVLLAIRQLRQIRSPGPAGSSDARSSGRLFLDGVLVDLLNPKTALFFVAFLPQFVDPEGGSAPIQIVVLGLVFVGLAALIDGTYALVAGGLAERIGSSPRAQTRIGATTVGIYLGLATLTVVS